MMLNELRPVAGKKISGVYRLTGRVAMIDDEGIAYHRMRLSNSEEDLVVLSVNETVNTPARMGHLELLEVKASVYVDAEGQHMLLTDARRPMPGTMHKLPPLQTLPRCYSAAPEILDEMVEQVRALTSPHLKTMISRVLERRELLEVFLKAPASRDYHHRETGGLLEHSLDVACRVMDLIDLYEPDMNRPLREIGFVAGLLHDIGKTLTMDVAGHSTPTARLCNHDDVTLEVCAYGLAYLDRMDKDAALALRHIWTCASPGVRYGYPSALALSRFVHDADGMSAAEYKKRNVLCRVHSHNRKMEQQRLIYSNA